MKQADLFILSTNIPLERNEGWPVRNKIHTKQGDLWLTVPVYGKFQILIKDVLICNDKDWRKRHINTLLHTYGKSKGKTYLPYFEEIYNKDWNRLVDLNVELIKLFCSILDIPTKIEVDEISAGKKQERFINLGKKYRADAYLSGEGAKLYLTQEDIRDVESNGISFLIHKHTLSQYPYSTLHYLMTEGKEWIQHVI